MRSGEWNISYIDRQGRVTHRRITILDYRDQGRGGGRMRALCHLRGEERTFILSRVLSWSPAGSPGVSPPASPAVPVANHPLVLAEKSAPAILDHCPKRAPGKQRRPAFRGLLFAAGACWLFCPVIQTQIAGVVQKNAAAGSVAEASAGKSAKAAKTAAKATVAVHKAAAIAKPRPQPPAPPVPDPNVATNGDLARWSNAQLDAEYDRLKAEVEREGDIWMQEVYAIGELERVEVHARLHIVEKLRQKWQKTQDRFIAVMEERGKRITAENRRRAAAESAQAAARQQEVAYRTPSGAQSESAMPTRRQRDLAFTQATGTRSAAVLDLFATADADGNGQLDWSEVRRFQQQLFAGFKYLSNATALSPDQFVGQGGGDCEDWAIMTVGMLQYWGIHAFVGSFQNPNDSTMHHAVALVRAAPVPGDMIALPLTGMTEWHTNNPLPDGQYVPIDYRSVGAYTSVLGADWKLTCMTEAVRMYGEGW